MANFAETEKFATIQLTIERFSSNIRFLKMKLKIISKEANNMFMLMSWQVVAEAVGPDQTEALGHSVNPSLGLDKSQELTGSLELTDISKSFEINKAIFQLQTGVPSEVSPAQRLA